MTNRIDEDHKDFMDVYAGRIRKALKKYINNGHMFRLRGNGDRIRMTIPRIDIPHLVYGDNEEGVGRGKGKKGDVIGREDPNGKGNGATDDEGEGIDVDISLDEVIKFMKEELQLPDLKPKPNSTFEDVKIKYNDISRTGPESLRHSRRTWLQALKRVCASGEADKVIWPPGFGQPIRSITIINDDKRYRQYKEIRMPANNAVIFFARDGSGSMDQEKCDIVSDMAWWIDVWIRKFYQKVERVYVWHDTVAQEFDENKFYKYRYGGGTMCSSAMKFISKQLENRYPPANWNIYVFYFTDGENWDGDNEKFMEIIKNKLPPDIVNFIGITQILAWDKNNSLKGFVDNNMGNISNIRTTEISGHEVETNKNMLYPYYGGGNPELTDEERDKQVKQAIIDLLGNPKKYPKKEEVAK